MLCTDTSTCFAQSSTKMRKCRMPSAETLEAQGQSILQNGIFVGVAVVLPHRENAGYFAEAVQLPPQRPGKLIGSN
jgi:hypothetical protein